jgi:hypothetical protein
MRRFLLRYFLLVAVGSAPMAAVLWIMFDVADCATMRITVSDAGAGRMVDPPIMNPGPVGAVLYSKSICPSGVAWKAPS